MAFVTAEGEVTRVVWDGKGATVKESFTKRDGTEGAAYYTAFFDEPHGLNVGDTGRFNGILGVKPSTYTGSDGKTRTGVDVTINSTRFTPAGDSDPF